MPQAATPNMSLVLPTPGADIGVWDDELDTAFTLLDGHDHSSGKGVRIGIAGININGDLSFNGNSAVNLKSADFGEVAAVASGARRIFWSSVDHEMYIRTAGGVNVKVTSGAGLNLSLIGGIVGDYSSVGAEAAYDDANNRFTFKQQIDTGVRQWARLDASDLDLYEFHAHGNTTNVTKRVRLKSPASLANNYDVTFPDAVPGSQAAVQMTSGGALVASNTFPQAATFNGNVTAGAVTVDLSAASAVKDRSRTRPVEINDFGSSSGADSFSIGNNARYDATIQIPSGESITDIVFGYARTSGTITFALVVRDFVGGHTTPVTKNDNSSTGNTTISLASSPTTGSLPQTTDGTHGYVLRITTDGTGALTFYNARIVSSRTT